MRRISYILFVSFIFCFSSFSQEIGTWRSHLSFYNTTQVEETNDRVFAVANGSLYSYDKADKSLREYTTLNGLNDMGVNLIAYNQESNTLIITYTGGNIDLLTLSDNRVKNLPFIKQDVTLQDKKVRHIFSEGAYAYLSTSFGIVQLNTDRQEIADTYRLRIPVNAVTLRSGSIYAATNTGILYGLMSENLVDPNKWKNYSLSLSLTSNDIVKNICFFQDQLTFFISGKDNHGVYYIQDAGTIGTIAKRAELNNFTLQNRKLILYTNSQATVMSSLTNMYTFSNNPIHSISSLKDENIFWIATGDNGIKGIKRNNGSFDILLSETKINSPIRNFCAFMSVQDGKLIVAGGGRWANREEMAGTLMVNENNSWFSVDRVEMRNTTGFRFDDIVSAAIDPLDPTHYFASSWGEGVYEFKKNEFVERYDYHNSLLQSAYLNRPNYTRVEGLTFDKYNNLWMTNSEVSNGIKVLKADRTWSEFSFSELNKQYLIDKILITKDNHKWVNVLRSSSFLFVFDDNGTIDDPSDDRKRKIENFYQMMGGQTSMIDISMYNCMVEDKKNNTIWLGTNVGPVIVSNPSKVLANPDEGILAHRPVRVDEEGLTGYLLESENINAIAIDGGNRKWLGTETKGVIVVSEDGSADVEHFTMENSPLPSNKIQSLAINNLTGEVFIGTDQGIVSYMSGSSQGSESYSDVYAYPNPVRPEHFDQVTITGLMADSNVKITDINGNLIIQGRSLGGQFTWNCRNRSGERVATGIYLVLASQPNSGESVVTKIMVVK
ncbi:hypothetical protein LJC57_00645 [Parabacteroides sp. OttesenSCG-928-G07]|nr:hypothetical protein [Parabacteroides sp. OttesenSCG-928-G21]MDL2277078.1 hypothetical protein [Parabacteroides sp. OttesenSCG-928-G07]